MQAELSVPRIAPEDYRALAKVYRSKFDLRTVRKMMHLIRETPDLSANLFIAPLGLTLGEFAVLYLTRQMGK